MVNIGVSKEKVKIKSTKVSLKFSNPSKLKQIDNFIIEYRRVVKETIDNLWEIDNIPKFLRKCFSDGIDTWLSVRAMGAAGAQASGIVRGTRVKQAKRLYVIKKLIEEGKFKRAKKLQKIYDSTKVTKPEINNVEPELSSKFVRINLDNNNTNFDGWVTLTSLGRGLKLIIPFKKTKHFNKLLLKGSLKPGIRLSSRSMSFSFAIPKKSKIPSGNILGIDVGQTTLLSCSDGQVSKKDKHNHDLISITQKLARKKKGSKAFQKAVTHRKNYINWSINQLNLSGITQVNVENIKHLRRGRKSSRALSHWTYTEIFDKLESYCGDVGVQIVKINSTYTSQRCSECGWTCKSNRKGKLFKCGKCGYVSDADLNASKNIALNLPRISSKKRLEHLNKTGFYWNVLGQEPVVPSV